MPTSPPAVPHPLQASSRLSQSGLQARAVEAALQLLSPSITNGGNAGVLVVSAAPQLKPFNSICFVMASIYPLSACGSQPQA
jgi:hypothetical protein